MSIEMATGEREVSGPFEVDVTRGRRVGRVASEWFARPADERYLSLSALHEAVRDRAARSTVRTVESRAIRVEASRDDAEGLALALPGREEPVVPTHWSSHGLNSVKAVAGPHGSTPTGAVSHPRSEPVA